MNFLCAVRCSDCQSVFQLKERHEAGISFLDRNREARQTVRRWLVIGGSSTRPCYERQGKMHLSLSNHPHSNLSSKIVAEIDETGDVGKSEMRRKACDIFLCQHIRKLLVGINNLCKEGGGLLPLALPGDVTVISPAKRKDREKMSFVLEIIAQPAPCSVIRRSNLRERRCTELGLSSHASTTFHCIHVTDRPEPAS